MAKSIRAVDHMPMFVINICSSEDNNNNDDDKLAQRTTAHTSNFNPLARSLSTPNYGQAYKDLSGMVHHSSSNRCKSFVTRCHSYPNNYLITEKSHRSQSPTATLNCDMGLLDPYNGTQSPGGSSSRYSLYGSFFDLSESGYHPSLLKTENKLLTIDGKPLLIVDHASKLSTKAYQDKCKDWLTQLDTM